MNRILALAVFLALAACRQDVPPRTPSPLTAPEPSVNAHAAGVAAAQVIAPAEAAASTLALDAEGLRLFNSVSGASRLIPFGTAKLDALRAIGAAQKSPARTEGRNEECKADFVTWDNGLKVWFVKDRLVGWSAGKSAAPVATAAGLRVGSSRSDLLSAYDARIRKSTLGIEFSAGGLAGLLESEASGAAVTDLWAGQTCIAR